MKNKFLVFGLIALLLLSSIGTTFASSCDHEYSRHTRRYSQTAYSHNFYETGLERDCDVIEHYTMTIYDCIHCGHVWGDKTTDFFEHTNYSCPDRN